MSNSYWESNLDKVLEIIKNSESLEEAAEECSKFLGKDVTSNAVSSAIRRLRREKGYDLPTAQDMLGTAEEAPVVDFNPIPWLDDEDDTPIRPIRSARGPDTLPTILTAKTIPKRLLVIPDCHYPFHDPYAVSAMMAYARDRKPDAGVILGDLRDVGGLSRHDSSHSANKLLDVKYLMKTEAESVKPLLDELISIVNGGNIWWIPGNHEGRLNNLINANPTLRGLRSLEPREFFEVPNGITWVDDNEDGSARRLKIGNAFFEHGHKIINSRGSAHIANTMAMRRPWCNTFVGHWHCTDRKERVAFWPDGRDETFITASLGHLSTVKDHSHYVSLPNWSHGFGEIEFWQDRNGEIKFSFDQIVMVNQSFSRNGKLYSGHRLM